MCNLQTITNAVMASKGVIVEFSCPEDVSSLNVSCSGILLASDLILTHGTILMEILQKKEGKQVIHELATYGHSSGLGNCSNIKEAVRKSRAKFKIITSQDTVEEVTKCVEPRYLSGFPEVPQSIQEPVQLWKSKEQKPFSKDHVKRSHIASQAEVELIWVCEDFRKGIEELLPPCSGWKFHDAEEEDEFRTELLNSLILQSFVILSITDENEPSSLNEALLLSKLHNILHTTTNAEKGSTVYVVSSPFGGLSPSVFLNSLSRGIVSSVSGPHGSVMLTDARCLMGAEGAPVYIYTEGGSMWCGIVVSAFCWKGGEWLGLSLVASAHAVLSSLLLLLSAPHDTISEGSVHENKETKIMLTSEETFFDPMISPQLPKEWKQLLDLSVVGLKCGGGWGSGVVVSEDPPIVITCAHVVAPAVNKEVDIIVSNGKEVKGHIVFQTEKGSPNLQMNESVWDLAVVLAAQPLPAAMPLLDTTPLSGTPVLAVGYGLFPLHHLSSPLVSQGVIAKVISIPQEEIENAVTAFSSRSNSNCHLSQAPVMSSNANGLSSDQEVKGPGSFVPIMVQTSCAVYAGMSGGALLALHRKHGPQMVGMLVCNARDMTNKATYPHINMAIPVSSIASSLKQFVGSQDIKDLRSLDFDLPVANKIWALGHKPKSQL